MVQLDLALQVRLAGEEATLPIGIGGAIAARGGLLLKLEQLSLLGRDRAPDSFQVYELLGQGACQGIGSPDAGGDNLSAIALLPRGEAVHHEAELGAGLAEGLAVFGRD